ncbi:substrate-binding domain-containing protein [Agrobacterium cavarae]|uniref:substrate-binding domain-containing protein n=1 Tax=Agrobacterium cavarae TaxID=2528239 RepID=UPI003FD59DC8
MKASEFSLRGQTCPASAFFFGDAKGIEKAIGHRVGLGHKRTGFVAGRKSRSSAEGRQEGDLRALGAGPGFDNTVIVGHEWSLKTGYSAGLELLHRDDPPTAIVCASYLSKLGLLDFVQERGLVMPRDLSIIVMPSRVPHERRHEWRLILYGSSGPWSREPT